MCKIQSLGLLFLVAYISFYVTSADIFLNVLELYSTLSEKTIFVTNFPFLTDSLTHSQPPLPFFVNAQKLIMVFGDYYTMMTLEKLEQQSRIQFQSQGLIRLVKNIYLWQENFYKSHSMQYWHL